MLCLKISILTDGRTRSYTWWERGSTVGRLFGLALLPSSQRYMPFQPRGPISHTEQRKSKTTIGDSGNGGSQSSKGSTSRLPQSRTYTSRLVEVCAPRNAWPPGVSNAQYYFPASFDAPQITRIKRCDSGLTSEYALLRGTEKNMTAMLGTADEGLWNGWPCNPSVKAVRTTCLPNPYRLTKFPVSNSIGPNCGKCQLTSRPSSGN